MDYYRLLRLEREPFSNSPDPDYFFQSRQHTDCLHRLELALRLKRGLNVVIGEVGTGKTTLCRELIRRFADQPEMETHLILDPSFDAPGEFLTHLGQLLSTPQRAGRVSGAESKEQIKQSLLSKAVDQNRTVILIIDEGQKISSACIEQLRELLNFETNTFKLLQIVIFAQPEFESILQSQANFTDRINLLHHLRPMNFSDTREMIRYRIRLASAETPPRNLFTLPAVWSIYRASQGYPRQIIHLCHQSMLALIIQNRSQAGWRLVRSCRKRLKPIRRQPKVLWMAAGLIGLAVGMLIVYSRWSAPMMVSAQSFFKIPSQTTPREETPRPDSSHPIASASISIHQPDESTADAPSSPPPQVAQLIDSKDPTGPEDALDAGVSPPPPQPTSPAPPEILGAVAVRPGDTLASMMRRIYGEYRPRLVRAVLAANPTLRDPDTVEVGTRLIFPAVGFARTTTAETGAAWIVLHDEGALSDAVAFQSALQGRWGLLTRLIVTWTPHEGLRFHVALAEPVTSPSAAQAQFAALAEVPTVNAQIKETWPSDTQFHSILSPAP